MHVTWSAASFARLRDRPLYDRGQFSFAAPFSEAFDLRVDVCWWYLLRQDREKQIPELFQVGPHCPQHAPTRQKDCQP